MSVDTAPDWIRSAPKVLLHDHLDGGLRVATILEVAERTGYARLPSHDLDQLTTYFHAASSSGNLVDYLSRFDHAYGVLQDADSLHRVARENVLDLAADGIRYAESRFGPELHTAGGLRHDEVVRAVCEGTEDGIQQAARLGMEIDVRLIVSAMRQGGQVAALADLMLAIDSDRVVGFDIAGQERQYPAGQFADVTRRLLDHGIRLTVHAGEGDGVESVRAAAVECGAERLGHGVRLCEDRLPDGSWGPVATFVRDQGIVLETSPTSNVHTGAVASYAAHPALLFLRDGFRATVNTDNRLMSRTTLSDEFAHLLDLGMTKDEFARLTLNAARGAFLPEPAASRLVRALESELAVSY